MSHREDTRRNKSRNKNTFHHSLPFIQNSSNFLSFAYTLAWIKTVFGKGHFRGRRLPMTPSMYNSYLNTFDRDEKDTSKKASGNFDEIDRSGFMNFAKRNFDEIDRVGFSNL
ncbi:unnamed protein product [Hermetia illucens]|uniref:Uncharacterized protein n=1 Tax=Hermetia illucens TaxID=343691 RepID=A0A7R8UY26_HERIL|nr:unnamed protein product [Hermetia illucens]